MIATMILMMMVSGSQAADLRWGTNAHEFLMDEAFSYESPACLEQLKKGSADVDAFEHQFSLELSYQHAMRAPYQSVETARTKMLAFIAQAYKDAREALARGDADTSCFQRGRGLHPIQDSTSPVHEGFQVWDPYLNPLQILDHGDQPFSKETLEALRADPPRLQRTIDLMRETDTAGMLAPH